MEKIGWDEEISDAPKPVKATQNINKKENKQLRATLIQEREHDGAADEVLVPLVAGMAELQPWVDQWHDEDGDLNLAEFTREVLRHHMGRLSVTADDLHDWRPPAPTRGRRRTTKGT